MKNKACKPLTKFLPLLAVVAALVTFSATVVSAADDGQLNPQQRRSRGRGGAPVAGVYKSTVTPHWFANDTKFWYMNSLRGGAREFIMVAADQGTRQRAFDHDKLASALSKASGQEFKGDHLPFSSIEFAEDGKSVKFDAANKTWKCDLNSYECTPIVSSEGKASLPSVLPVPSLLAKQADDTDSTADDDSTASFVADEQDLTAPQQDQQRGQRQGGGRGAGRGGGRGGRGQGFLGARQLDSPDGKWTALIKDFNVYIHPKTGGDEIQLSHDGVTNNSYGRLSWSPDSKNFVAWRIEPGDDGQVYLIRSSPEGGGRAIMTQRSYPQAGDKFTSYELSLFDAEADKQTKPDVDRVDFRSPNPRWSKDGSHFTYEKEDRGHTRFRVIDVDARTGAIRNVIDDQPKTFIWTDNTDAFQGQLRLTTYLEGTDEIIYESEQDGWRHLYLYDIKDAKLKNQITKGQWLVRGIDLIDQDKRQIWFSTCGLRADQDPYFVNYCRINFDGSGLVVLTEGNGSHSVAYSPDRKYLIDTYSRMDLPPVNNLRRTSDGALVCKLEESDIAEWQAANPVPPERFVAKGRDGQTDIYGVIDRPRNFDPNKKYPILEDIYAGPQGTGGTISPCTFTGRAGHANYTSLGFIVVKIDGMGTANRSKAFHDVCWHNLADAGFPDRILWIKAAAEKYPYMDTNHVGIYGTSAGGQNAAGAVLFHPEFYKAAVANSGCHDNRIDKSSWNEQWMGYMPKDKIWSKDDDNWYSKCSNIDNAAKLRGKLFLIVGELDSNVPPESTYRFVDALIKAGKDFDLLVVPGADHGASSRVTQRRTQDFLVLNLMGKLPPNRNAGETNAATASN